MAKRTAASPGTAFVAPLFGVDTDGEILFQIDELGDVVTGDAVELDELVVLETAEIEELEVTGGGPIVVTGAAASTPAEIDDDTGGTPDAEWDLVAAGESYTAANLNNNFATIAAALNLIFAILQSEEAV